MLTDILVYASWVVALLLGLLMSRRRGWVAAAGIGVGLAWWAVFVLTGSFEPDPEGTAPALGLIYGVPLFALTWAAAVGAGYVAQTLWTKTRPRVGSR